MRILRLIITMAVFLSAVPVWAQQSEYQTGMIPAPHILLPPDGDLTAMVFLISGEQGWSSRDDAQATALVDAGAAVVGIDLPSYLRSLAKDEGDCIYMVSDVEDISQQVQRHVGNPVYRHPIVAGTGEGGALALAMVSQSPPVTVGQAVVVDPQAGIPLAKQLCTPASKDKVGDRTVYGFQEGTLPAQVTIAFTPSADPAGVAHAQRLKADHPDVQIQQVGDSADIAFIKLLNERISESGKDGQPLELPLTVLDAKPGLDTMAVVFSGDGGWRDIDSEAGSYLQKQGIPTVGVDSLRYFWSERQPQQVAQDLARIISTYRRQWGVSNVLLIGYSFGADVLPAAYNRLPAAEKARVKQISLLALSKEVDYEISVTGWLGIAGDGDGGDTVSDIAKIDPALVQCVYGTEEDDDPCPELKDKGVETVPIEGGHHFDEDYQALGRRIVDSLKRRIGR